MIKNNVGGNVGTVQNSTLHAGASHDHDKKPARPVRRVDDARQRLPCLLHPPLHHAHRPSSTSNSLKPQKGGPLDIIAPGDCERSDNTPASPPTPSSSRARAPDNTTQASSNTARAGKRRDFGETDVAESIVVEKEAKALDQGSSLAYKLILVQEPTTGTAFEDNLLGRIGLAPPLILELEVTRDGKVEDASEEVPFLICQCSLLKEDGTVADMVDKSVTTATTSSSSTLLPPTPKRSRKGRRSSSSRRGSTRSTESSDPHTPVSAAASPSATPASSGDASPSLARMLYGTIVAGPQQFQSPEGSQEKPYFFFPEISIRTTGKFKIQCRLMRLALPGISPSETGILASVETNTFEVVKRENYTAPYITDVSRHFARLGVPLLLPPGVSAD